MKKFQFGLERVLAWRRLQLQLESAALTKLRWEHNQLLEQRRQLLAQQDAARIACGAGKFAASEMYTLAAYQERCRQLDVAMQQEAKTFESRVAAQQQRMVEADRAVRLLEKLRSQRYEQWQHEAAAKQEEFASEAFLCRWNART